MYTTLQWTRVQNISSSCPSGTKTYKTIAHKQMPTFFMQFFDHGNGYNKGQGQATVWQCSVILSRNSCFQSSVSQKENKMAAKSVEQTDATRQSTNTGCRVEIHQRRRNDHQSAYHNSF